MLFGIFNIVPGHVPEVFLEIAANIELIILTEYHIKPTIFNEIQVLPSYFKYFQTVFVENAVSTF